MKKKVDLWMKVEEQVEEKNVKRKQDSLTAELENITMFGKYQTVSTVEDVNDKIDNFIENSGVKKFKYEKSIMDDNEAYFY